MGKLDGKVAIITGSNKSIVKGIARGLAAESADLVLAARDIDALNRTTEELTTNDATVLAVPTDVTDETQLEALFEHTIARFNRLDILVNNSGAFDGGPLDELPLRAFSVYPCSNEKG